MRFKRLPRVEGYTETSRKRAAVLVSQRRQREKLPLFAELIAETQPSVDEVIAARHDFWPRRQQERRDRAAAEWRDARRQLAAFPPAERAALLRYWNNHRWLPADPTYLKGELHSFRTGRLVLVDGGIRSQHDIDWERNRDARIRALSDAELDRMIQTHISMQFVELARAERQRRAQI